MKRSGAAPAIRAVPQYLHRRGAVRPIEGRTGGAPPECVVVIPARAESEYLPSCLESVARSAGRAGIRPLVVVVVNNPDPGQVPGGNRTAAERDAEDNRRTLEWLRRADFAEIALAWIDCASPGCELPPKRGVGLARKIGCDSAIALVSPAVDNTGRHSRGPDDVVLLSLDADTVVASNWLEGAISALRGSGAPGGLCRFRHRLPDDPSHREAACAYELYMRYYLEALRQVGSPYAFAVMGSALACTAAGYCRAGGFPASRQAGEDFYFAQQLARTGGLIQFLPALVRPSSRLSQRVPFGTGPAVQRIMDSGIGQYLVFAPEAFAVVGGVLRAAETAAETGQSRETFIAGLPESTRDFFTRRGLARVWERFLQQFREPRRRLAAFHEWFDGLMTLQLLRRLTESGFPPVPILEAVRSLPGMADRLRRRRGAADVQVALAAIRCLQHRRREVLGPHRLPGANRPDAC